jgi:hypothetical protein
VIIEGIRRTGGCSIAVADVEAAERSVQIVVKLVGSDFSLCIEFDTNHARAFEAAVCAARLEVEARAVAR